MGPIVEVPKKGELAVAYQFNGDSHLTILQEIVEQLEDLRSARSMIH